MFNVFVQIPVNTHKMIKSLRCNIITFIKRDINYVKIIKKDFHRKKKKNEILFITALCLLRLPTDVLGYMFEFLPYSHIYELYMSSLSFFNTNSVSVYECVVYSHNILNYTRLNFKNICLKYNQIIDFNNIINLNNLHKLDLIICDTITDNSLLQLSSLSNLNELNIISCNGLITPVINIPNLRIFSIFYSSLLSHIDLTLIVGLRYVEVSTCYMLLTLKLSDVNELIISNCDSLMIIDLCKTNYLSKLKISNCNNIIEFNTINSIYIDKCRLSRNNVINHSIFVKLKNTHDVSVINCPNFTGTEFKYLKNLKNLYISQCNNINTNNLLYFAKLNILYIDKNNSITSTIINRIDITKTFITNCEYC